MRISLSKFRIDSLLSGQRRFLFLYGNDQQLQRKFIDFVIASIKSSDSYQTVKIQSSTAKSFKLPSFDDPFLFHEKSVCLHIIENVTDSFIPTFNDVLSTADIFVLMADSYRVSKKISELLIKHTSCDCIGLFNNNERGLIDLAQVICKTFTVGGKHGDTGDFINFFSKELGQPDANIASVIFKIQMLGDESNGILANNTESTISPLAKTISDMEPISAIRFYINSICQGFSKGVDLSEQQTKVIKNLWLLEKNIKLSNQTDPSVIRSIIYQSLSAA